MPLEPASGMHKHVKPSSRALIFLPVRGAGRMTTTTTPASAPPAAPWTKAYMKPFHAQVRQLVAEIGQPRVRISWLPRN